MTRAISIYIHATDYSAIFKVVGTGEIKLSGLGITEAWK